MKTSASTHSTWTCSTSAPARYPFRFSSAPQHQQSALFHVEEDDLVEVNVHGTIQNDDSGGRAQFRGNGTVPDFARAVSVPTEPGKQFVVLAEATAGRPFFRCGTDEVELRTVLHLYGTDEAYAALPPLLPTAALPAAVGAERAERPASPPPPPAKRPRVKDEVKDEEKEAV